MIWGESLILFIGLVPPNNLFQIGKDSHNLYIPRPSAVKRVWDLIFSFFAKPPVLGYIKRTHSRSESGGMAFGGTDVYL